MAYAEEYEHSPAGALRVAADALLHVGDGGTRLTAMPATALIAGKSLIERHGMVRVSGRTTKDKVVHLTSRGRLMRDAYVARCAVVEKRSRMGEGGTALVKLRQVLETFAASDERARPLMAAVGHTWFGHAPDVLTRLEAALARAGARPARSARADSQLREGPHRSKRGRALL
jgi:hypothetical protein